MSGKRVLTGVAVVVCAIVAWLVVAWTWRGPTASSGGLYFPWREEIPVPQFFQADLRWHAQPLGATTNSMGAQGCAVSSAAMVLASYGEDVDPGRLNAFLTALPGGYTPEGWIYWEKAAQYDPKLTARLLPHYESLPSWFLIDWNLLRGNPVIVRLDYGGGHTHFVVICGKDGYDYLIHDPGSGGARGVYPLRELTDRVDALRFYRKP